jgi:hypothetical protein
MRSDKRSDKKHTMRETGAVISTLVFEKGFAHVRMQQTTRQATQLMIAG